MKNDFFFDLIPIDHRKSNVGAERRLEETFVFIELELEPNKEQRLFISLNRVNL